MSALSPLLTQATPVNAVRGEGMWLYDADDRRYLDFTAGIGVTSTGHCHPAVVAAITEQAGRLIHGQYTTVRHPGLDTLADALSARLPDQPSICFSSTGGEAVESAIRLARHATGRAVVMAFRGGFHGRSMGAAALTTSKLAVRAGIGPLMGSVTLAPFPDARRWGVDEDEAVARALDELDVIFASEVTPEETAAMFIEPVLGEGGYIPTPPAFLAGLRERCDRHGILLVADEVQTGVGRTGRFWAMEHSGVQADVVITAKGLASGMPLSAIAAAPDLMAKGFPGSQGGTYGGNAVACAASLATLEVIDREGLVANAESVGGRLMSACRSLADDHPVIGDVRGLGLMIGLEMTALGDRTPGEVSAAVRAAAADAGLLLLPCGPQGQVVRLVPALVVADEHCDAAVATLDKVLGGLAG